MNDQNKKDPQTNPARKLKLKKETIRDLSNRELSGVAGGRSVIFCGNESTTGGCSCNSCGGYSNCNNC